MREEGNGRPLSASVDDTFTAIKSLIENESSASTRCLSREVGVPESSSVRYHSFKATFVQEPSDDDHNQRLVFSEWFLSRLESQPQFHLRIVFSDAVFHVNGSVNKHNLHYWIDKNPRVFVEKPQHQNSVTVWAMMNNTGVLSFDLSEQTLNGERYFIVLKQHVIPSD